MTSDKIANQSSDSLAGGSGWGVGAGGGSRRKRRSEYQWDILTLSSQSQLYVNEDLPALIRTVLARFTESSRQSHKLYDMTCCQHQQQQNLQ